MLLMFSRQQLEDEMVHTIAVTGAQACVAAALQSLRVIQEHSQLLLSKSNTYNLHGKKEDFPFLDWFVPLTLFGR